MRQDPQLFSLNLVLKVSGPGLKEELSCLRVENLLLGHVALRVHRQRCLLRKQTSME